MSPSQGFVPRSTVQPFLPLFSLFVKFVLPTSSFGFLGFRLFAPLFPPLGESTKDVIPNNQRAFLCLGSHIPRLHPSLSSTVASTMW